MSDSAVTPQPSRRVVIAAVPGFWARRWRGMADTWFKRLQEMGFTFEFAKLQPALENLLSA